VRAMAELEPRVIPGTEADAPVTPVFSPDGEWVAYWAVNGGQIKRIRIGGGAAVAIATVSSPSGMSWAPDGTIWIGQPDGLVRVSAAGGAPELMVPAVGEEVFWGPRLLPDGDHVLFSVADGSQLLEAQWDEARIVVQSLSSGERVVMVEGGTEATFLPSGHLVYAAGGTLFAVPFDADRLAVTGVPVPLVQDVLRPDTGQGTAHYGVADDGTLVYASGSGFSRALYWVDREGREEPIGAPPRVYAVPRLSPDESAVALQADGDLWIYSLARGTLERLTADAGRDSDPVWSPDGTTIAYYAVGRDGGPGLFRRAANGTGDVERLAAGTRLPLSWSPDGSRLVFIDFGSNPIADPATAPLVADVDLGVIVFEEDPAPRPLLTTQVREDVARISPDGRWLAAETNETGQIEVFVRPFPQVDGPRWRISLAGGHDPVWSREGGAFFYRQDRLIMEVPVGGSDPSAWGRPQPVVELEAGYYFTNGPTNFDVASDGRFLMLKDTLADPGRAPRFVVVPWFEELRRLVPTH